MGGLVSGGALAGAMALLDLSGAMWWLALPVVIAGGVAGNLWDAWLDVGRRADARVVGAWRTQDAVQILVAPPTSGAAFDVRSAEVTTPSGGLRTWYPQRAVGPFYVVVPAVDGEVDVTVCLRRGAENVEARGRVAPADDAPPALVVADGGHLTWGPGVR